VRELLAVYQACAPLVHFQKACSEVGQGLVVGEALETRVQDVLHVEDGDPALQLRVRLFLGVLLRGGGRLAG